jgi:hypothetical protein
MTLEQAKALRHGQTIYANTCDDRSLGYFRNGGRNADGTPMRFRVTSVRTWKTSPESVVIGLKRGLRGTFKITEDELAYFSLTES